ncbi:MAG: stage V sporulation protein AB [Alkaliphilus sp.]
MRTVIVIIVGFASGTIVGSGIVALITLLDIVPRLAQLTKTYSKIRAYENTIILGATFGAIASITDFSVNANPVLTIIIGFYMGVFVGLLAAAIAEVMNVIPIIVRRNKIEGYVVYILFALIAGKIVGTYVSLFFF